MIIVVLVVMLVLLSMGGLWGMVTAWYIEIEELITQPLLRVIADEGIKLLWLFLPVCVFLMSVRRFFTYFPAWFSLYFLLHIVGSMSKADSYQYIIFFIVASGFVKAADVMKNDYYPNSKHWRGRDGNIWYDNYAKNIKK